MNEEAAWLHEEHITAQSQIFCGETAQYVREIEIDHDENNKIRKDEPKTLAPHPRYLTQMEHVEQMRRVVQTQDGDN
jgi:hypothetical protein